MLLTYNHLELKFACDCLNVNYELLLIIIRREEQPFQLCATNPIATFQLQHVIPFSKPCNASPTPSYESDSAHRPRRGPRRGSASDDVGFGCLDQSAEECHPSATGGGGSGREERCVVLLFSFYRFASVLVSLGLRI